MILITIILMDLLTGMEFDLFLPSSPQIQSHFALSPFLVEALLSINFLGYCSSLFLVGSLADRYGRKPIIMLGLLIFVIGSIFCIFQESYIFILIGRFLQGIGIAAPAILSFLIIADSYPIKEQQFLMAMLNGALNVAAALAPVIGSYLTLYFNWQGNFLALLILGLISLIMTIIFIPHNRLPSTKETLSWREYIPIFKSKPLMLLIIHFLFIIIPYWIFVGMSPLLYIKNLGVSLSHFGYYQGILALIFALGSVLFGLFLKKYSFNQQRMLNIGIQILIVSFLLMTFITLINSANPLLITFAMIIFVIGQIIPSIVLYPLCLNFMPQAKGKVSAIIQGGRLIISALGLQLVSYFYQNSFQNIGLMIIGFILMAIITLLFVTRMKLENTTV